MPTADVPGIRYEAVEQWLADYIDATPPLDLHLIAGGESNYTIKVTDSAERSVVLRRPPEGELQATAHDVLREARIMHALHGTKVPVPGILGSCDDASVTGSSFYVMTHVDGHVLRTADQMRATFPEGRRPDACRRLLDTLAAIHAVDLESVGLDGLAKREGYVARQLKRWRGQWEGSGSPYAPLMSKLHNDLVASMPAAADEPATLVHGDFRFDNSVVSSDGEVLAVLDWELSTLGDPLADLAITLIAWTAPGEAMTRGVEGPTSAEGCLTRRQAVDHYGQATGRDVSDLSWYLAWADWRVACILSGVYARNAGGVGVGTQTTDEYLADLVMRADKARSWLDGVEL